jgi:hypothetical protein
LTKHSKEGRNLLKSRRRVGIAVAVTGVTCAIAFSGVALAALPGAPTLVSPKHNAHLGPGHITLVVHDTAVPSGFNVFVQISKHRKVDKFGDLTKCNNVNKGCDFVSLKRRKGHPGQWIYKTDPGVSFPGWWATTPGTYYWQADHVDCSVAGAHSCAVISKIGSFHVS